MNRAVQNKGLSLHMGKTYQKVEKGLVLLSNLL